MIFFFFVFIYLFIFFIAAVLAALTYQNMQVQYATAIAGAVQEEENRTQRGYKKIHPVMEMETSKSAFPGDNKYESEVKILPTNRLEPSSSLQRG